MNARGAGHTQGNVRGERQVTVYGRRAVLEALRTDTVRVDDVVWADMPADVRAEIAAACAARRIEGRRVSPEQVHAVSGDPRHDQNVAARLTLLNVRDVEALGEEFKGQGSRRPARALALDGITNPQNVGMVVRSAVAAGVDAVLWPTVGSPWVSGLVVKGSAGVVLRCPIAVCGALHEGVSQLARAGWRIYALDSSGESDLFSLRPAHRALFIIGSETTGISPEVRTLVDEWVRIPMQNGVESLNAAVAASMVCFHAVRAQG